MVKALHRFGDHFLVVGYPLSKSQLKNEQKRNSHLLVADTQVVVSLNRRELRDFFINELGPQLLHQMAETLLPDPDYPCYDD
jgi:hypothetical protein